MKPLLVTWWEVAQRNIPGGFARTRGLVLIAQWFAMFTIYFVIVGVFWVANRDHWTRSGRGTVAVYASAGLAFFLIREMLRRGDEGMDYLAGSDAETRVGEVLEPFRSIGWDVIHDVEQDRGGNVDHLVLAPNVAFAVETKGGRESGRAIGQALGGAAWAKEKYGRPWVNAVLCVGADPPSSPKKVRQARVTSVDDLPDLLRRLSGLR